MTNYFYTDANGQKQGPVDDQQLQALAAQGMITPETPLDMESGQTGQAGQIPGLSFPETPPDKPNPFTAAMPQASQSPPRATTWSVSVNSIIEAAKQVIGVGKERFMRLDQRRQFAVIAGAVLLVLLGGWWMLSAVVGGLGGSSYKRGTGAYVVSYANKSYDRAKWAAMCKAEDFEGFREFGSVSGWDKNNVAVTGSSSSVATFKNGDWKVITDPTDNYQRAKNATYNGANELLVVFTSHSINGISPGIVRKFTSTTIDYEDTKFPKQGYYYSHVFIYQVERDVIIYKSAGEIYELQGDKITQIPPSDKRLSVQSKDNKTQINLLSISLVHSYKNGRAVGYAAGRFVKYENGVWHEHFEPTPGDVIADIWAIDENNFIAVGSKGITQFRDGKMTHPMVQVKDWQFGTWMRVWGVDLNKYWLMDNKGNIAQIANGQVSGVVRAPDNITFTDAWVSPEGTVFAITGSEVYRLE